MWYLIGFVVVIVLALWFVAAAVSSLPILLISVAVLFGTFFSLLQLKLGRLKSKSVLMRVLIADFEMDSIKWQIKEHELNNYSDPSLLVGASLLFGGIALVVAAWFIRTGNIIVVGLILVGTIILIKPRFLIERAVKNNISRTIGNLDKELRGFHRLSELDARIRHLSSTWGFPFPYEHVAPIRGYVRDRPVGLLDNLTELNSIIQISLKSAEEDNENLKKAHNHFIAIKTYYVITSAQVTRSGSIYLIKEMELINKRLESDKLKIMIQNREWNAFIMNLDILKIDIKKVNELAQRYQESDGSWEEREINEDSAFRILGIPSSTNNEQIKVVYKRLALIYHPDSGIVKDESRMKKINIAFEFIQKQRGLS